MAYAAEHALVAQHLGRLQLSRAIAVSRERRDRFTIVLDGMLVQVVLFLQLLTPFLASAHLIHETWRCLLAQATTELV